MCEIGLMGWRIVFFLSGAQCAIALVLWRLYQHSDIIPELNSPVRYSLVKQDEKEFL